MKKKQPKTKEQFPSIFFFSFKKDAPTVSETVIVDSFDKVVVSPHIQVEFKQGEQELVRVEALTISSNKMNIEVTDKILKVYLHKAEVEVDLNSDESINWEDKSVYRGTTAKVTIIYKSLKKLALVGAEEFTFMEKIKEEYINLKLIGKTKLRIQEANIQDFNISSFGKNYLEVNSGVVSYQNITTFGEDELCLQGVQNEITDIKSLGNSKIKLNVSRRLNVTSMGNAYIQYKGNAKISKGIVMGNSKIERM
jgi:hypothetical protein